jgi:methyl-accepting chemotaxis protein/PAS domain-containing protein
VAAYFSSRSAAVLLGGMIVGIGIVCMHYLGMWALQVPGRFVWSWAPVAGSAVIAVALSAAALLIASRRMDRSSMVGAAVLLMTAIVGHHLTAMAAVEIVPDATRTIDAVSMSPNWLGTIVIVGAIVGLAVGLIGVVADRRLNDQSSRLAMALDNLAVGILIFDADERLVVCNKTYRQMYNVAAEVVRPEHGTLTGLLRYRTSNGTFREDPDKYLINLRESLKTGSSIHREPRLPDGRILSVTTHPMHGGGWVAIHENITEHRQSQEQLASMAARDQRRAWIEESISSFRARVEAVLKVVAESAAGMKSTASSLLMTSGQTSHSADMVLKSSSEASAGAETAAAAANELSQSIAEINQQLKQTTEIVRSAVADADKTNAEISGLTEAAQKIGDVVKFIQHIARQTNLLALNATIEAARAGGAGKGFGVVASEVKSLAIQTAKATEDIASEIAGVQTSMNRAVDAIHRITGQMQEIRVHATQTAISVEQQSTAVAEITRNVASTADSAQSIVSMLSEVATNAVGTRQSATVVLKTSEDMEAATMSLRGEVDAFLEKVAS